MKHLGMISGNLIQRRLTHHLVGDGNLDTVIHTPVDGFFQRQVALLDYVETGQHLGTILDPIGQEVAQIEADRDGLIIMLRGIPRVSAGDGIVHVTQLLRNTETRRLKRNVN